VCCFIPNNCCHLYCCFALLQYITVYYSILHYTTYTTVYYTILQYITLYYSILHYTTVYYTILQYIFAADFPIHPPRKEGDPFDVPLLGNLKFTYRMVEGVLHVYEDEGCAAEGRPIEWPYPDRQSYLAELNIMLSLISDGPL